MSPFWNVGFAGIMMFSATTYADAQMASGHHAGMSGATAADGTMSQTSTPAQPTAPGQDAFGTIQEIVNILEADPSTDWSKVNIAALREHLIDMNEVTLHANAVQHDLANGVEIAITGEGRTLEAIKRMIPAHAVELNQLGWSAKTEDLANGVTLTVTALNPGRVPELKALGLMGIMVLGTHHQMHHLMIARGEMVH